MTLNIGKNVDDLGFVKIGETVVVWLGSVGTVPVGTKIKAYYGAKDDGDCL